MEVPAKNTRGRTVNKSVVRNEIACWPSATPEGRNEGWIEIDGCVYESVYSDIQPLAQPIRHIIQLIPTIYSSSLNVNAFMVAYCSCM